MARKKREDTNAQPFEAVPGTGGVRFRAAQGGTPILSDRTYDGSPPPLLGPLGPRPECVRHAVPTRPATAEELVEIRRLQGRGDGAA